MLQGQLHVSQVSIPMYAALYQNSFFGVHDHVYIYLVSATDTGFCCHNAHVQRHQPLQLQLYDAHDVSSHQV